MANQLIAFTLVASGSTDLSGVGFNPNDLEFFAAAKNGSAAQLSVVQGQVDSAGNQFAKQDYYGPTNYNQSSTNTRAFKVLEHNGSTWVTVLEFTFTTYLTDGFRINVNTYNSGSAYQVRGKSRLN